VHASKVTDRPLPVEREYFGSTMDESLEKRDCFVNGESQFDRLFNIFSTKNEDDFTQDYFIRHDTK